LEQISENLFQRTGIGTELLLRADTSFLPPTNTNNPPKSDDHTSNTFYNCHNFSSWNHTQLARCRQRRSKRKLLL
jgi:hypothetical protein